MKKLLLSSAVVLGLSGCQSTGGNNIQDLTCYFPDSVQDEAPKWVCDVMPDSIAIGSVGYAKKSAAGMSVMRTIAVNDARRGLAEQFESNVNTMFKQAMATTVQSTGEAVSEEVNEQFESVTKTMTSRTLSNSRVIVTQRSPAGGLYTLVGMDQATYDSNVAQVVEAASNKESGLWNKFNNKKAEESLQQALDSMIQ
ncbi:LPP20 family lipoprotein [Photobacterium rosenbergii]|uniref:LPP20 family lipoprotein n=1 Tax=Photobacterium rosenbergii TaxID=294936 RepID=A0ABU3ZL55_9GAMM|nr:LPP20 family lipoprotein [Photobacterium rosenbergii]MDV5170738.1 LPP20 family lipoprotein [Photobacterium rosenbergii]